MVGLIQVALDNGQKLSVGWQILPYLVITVSEVMVSITGLEFAYTQAPRSMKSTIMSFWLLTVAFGNMLAAVVSQLNVFTGAGEFFFFTGLMVAISIVFVAAAMGYQVRDFVETSDENEVLAAATQST
jgi:POT family proton-dependent oligopeptide transporter